MILATSVELSNKSIVLSLVIIAVSMFFVIVPFFTWRFISDSLPDVIKIGVAAFSLTIVVFLVVWGPVYLEETYPEDGILVEEEYKVELSPKPSTLGTLRNGETDVFIFFPQKEHPFNGVIIVEDKQARLFVKDSGEVIPAEEFKESLDEETLP